MKSHDSNVATSKCGDVTIPHYYIRGRSPLPPSRKGVRRVEFLGGVMRCILAARVGHRFSGAWSRGCLGIVGLVLSASVFVWFVLRFCLVKSLPLVLRGERCGCLSSFCGQSSSILFCAASLDLLHPSIGDCCSVVFVRRVSILHGCRYLITNRRSSLFSTRVFLFVEGLRLDGHFLQINARLLSERVLARVFCLWWPLIRRSLTSCS
ncbi:hypothetical protein Bca101_064124 [Brassica carinata]